MIFPVISAWIWAMLGTRRHNPPSIWIILWSFFISVIRATSLSNASQICKSTNKYHFWRCDLQSQSTNDDDIIEVGAYLKSHLIWQLLIQSMIGVVFSVSCRRSPQSERTSLSWKPIASARERTIWALVECCVSPRIHPRASGLHLYNAELDGRRLPWHRFL